MSKLFGFANRRGVEAKQGLEDDAALEQNADEAAPSRRQSHKSERGTVLFLGTMSLVFIVPLVGLAVDVGYLYTCKSRLQSAVDGSALAAARALNLGIDPAAQAVTSKQNARNWFYSNFPSSNWGTTNTIMNNNTIVVDDTSVPQLRQITITATTSVPTYFMKWFNFNSTVIQAVGKAARRDVVTMLVLDRSGSMCTDSSGNTHTSCTTQYSCGPMMTAAKLFTGAFAAGRDKIGMVSFSDNVVVASAPTTSFRTALGYSNTEGSGNGAIDSITCQGGTNTAAAFNLAYNEIYKIMLPGALNVLVLETDGKPNIVSVNLYDSANSKNGLSTTSNCTDRGGRKPSSTSFGGTAGAQVPLWNGTATTPAYNMGTGGFMANIPAGMIGGFGGSDSDSGANYLWRIFSSSVSDTIAWGDTGVTNSGGADATTGRNATPSTRCLGNAGMYQDNPIPDIAWLPTTDIFGDVIAGSTLNYKTVNRTTVSGVSRITTVSGDQVRGAAINATDQAAYRARNNATLPVMVFALGFSSSVDHVLMQRIANDPDGDSSAPYDPCASVSTCVTYPAQFQGTYKYAATTGDLAAAFQQLSSQILRLSR